MSADTQKYYEYRIFKPGELQNAFQKLLENINIGYKKYHIKTNNLIINDTYEDRDIEINELASLCEIDRNIANISISITDNNNGWHYVGISKKRDSLHIVYSLASIDYYCIIDNIEKDLSLVEYKDLKVKKSDRIKCFVSYRFDLKSKNYTTELIKFLELVGVEVVTGAGYEPRKVSEKVLTRLRESIDFIIYVITKEGESVWTRDEIAAAVGMDYRIIPLIEQGAELEKGILGDLEYIRFGESHISDAFINILEAIKFIKREKENES